jgi:hypothetical protein
MHRALLLALLLAGCATSPAEAQSVAPVPGLEQVAFEIKSWGRPIDGWDIHADGTARHVKRVSDEGAGFNTYRLEHREFAVDQATWERLSALAAQLPQPRPSRSECDELATDMPYGALRLSTAGSEEEIRFDLGCLDVPYQAFVGQLRAMDELVTGLAEKYQPTRIERVGGS